MYNCDGYLAAKKQPKQVPNLNPSIMRGGYVRKGRVNGRLMSGIDECISDEVSSLVCVPMT
jgi:hypothetical protein